MPLCQLTVKVLIGTAKDAFGRIWGRVCTSLLFLFALPRYSALRTAGRGGMSLRRSRADGFPSHLIAPVILLILALARPAAGEILIGPAAHVRDVDTIVVGHTPIRLNGIDGPELNTSVGRAARSWMIDFLQGEVLHCELNGHRSHDRMIGICYLDHTDIGAAAIRAGHALDCSRFSRGRYRHLETLRAKADLPRARYC